MALILLVLFIFVPLAEIAVFIRVGGVIGLGWTLVLVVLTAVIGTAMLRAQGFAVLRRAQRQLDSGVAPVQEVIEGACLLVAGALLLTPGFLTDAAGAALLLPPVRRWIFVRLRERIEIRAARARGGPAQGPPGPSSGGPSRAGGRGPGGPGGEPTTVDVDFEEVDPGEDRDAGADRSGRSDEPMPPPRGSWGQDR